MQLAPGVTLTGDAGRAAVRAVGLHGPLLDALLATSPDGGGTRSDREVRALVVDRGVPALRAFVTSATGVHVTLPGSGGFAPDYDGRERKKYTSALQQAARPGSVAWGELFTDRHGLGLVLPVAGVLHDRGAIRGVAGVELSLVWIAEHILGLDVAGVDEVLLLDAAGGVVVQRGPGAALSYATAAGPGESEAVHFASFTHEDARKAVAGPDAGVVELPSGRLVALYPLSSVPLTLVLVASPRLMTDER